MTSTLLRIKVKGKTFFRSQVKGPLAFLKDVVLLIRNRDRVLFVDYLDKKMGEYRVPPFLEGQLYFYEAVQVPQDYTPYLSCIAKAIEEKLLPPYRNRRLSCPEGLTVVLE